LFGYQPPSVIGAMQDQLNRGIEVGPQHPLAAEVAGTDRRILPPTSASVSAIPVPKR